MISVECVKNQLLKNITCTKHAKIYVIAVLQFLNYGLNQNKT